MEIIERILSILNEKSLKSADLCRFLGINTSTFTNWKNRGTDPPAKFIIPICEFVGVDCEYLLTGKKKTNSVSLSREDVELLDLVHQLPRDELLEFKGELRGYLKHIEKSSVAEEDYKKTGTDSLGK